MADKTKSSENWFSEEARRHPLGVIALLQRLGTSGLGETLRWMGQTDIGMGPQAVVMEGPEAVGNIAKGASKAVEVFGNKLGLAKKGASALEEAGVAGSEIAARHPVVLDAFSAHRGGFASPASFVVRSGREVTPEEIRKAFFSDLGPEKLVIEKLRQDPFMERLNPGRQPFKLQFLEGGRHIDVPAGIEERLGLGAGEQYLGPT